MSASFEPRGTDVVEPTSQPAAEPEAPIAPVARREKPLIVETQLGRREVAPLEESMNNLIDVLDDHVDILQQIDKEDKLVIDPTTGLPSTGSSWPPDQGLLFRVVQEEAEIIGLSLKRKLDLSKKEDRRRVVESMLRREKREGETDEDAMIKRGQYLELALHTLQWDQEGIMMATGMSVEDNVDDRYIRPTPGFYYNETVYSFNGEEVGELTPETLGRVGPIRAALERLFPRRMQNKDVMSRRALTPAVDEQARREAWIEESQFTGQPFRVVYNVRNESREALISLDDNTVIGPDQYVRHFSAFQRNFLKHYFKGVVAPTSPGKLTSEQQESYARRVLDMTQTRMDIERQVLGPKDIARIEPNFVTVDTSTPHVFKFNYSPNRSYSVFMTEGTTASTGTNVRERTESHIRAISESIRKDSSKRLLEAQVKDANETTLGRIRAKKTELDTAPVIDPELSRTVTEEIQEIDREITALQNKELLPRGLEPLDQELADLTTGPDAIPAAVITYNADYDVTSASWPGGSVGAARETRAGKKSVLDQRTLELEELKKRRADYATALQKSTVAAVQEKIRDTMEHLDGDINLKLGAVETARGEFDTEQRNVERMEAAIERYSTQLKRRTELLAAIAKKERELANLASTYTIATSVARTSGTAIPSEADIKEAQRQREEKKKEKLAKKKGIESPDIEERQYQREAYETLEGVITDFDEVQKRGLEAEHGELKVVGEAMYDIYPPVYLRTLSILFGPKVLEAGPENKVIFQRAVRMLPPTKFMQAMGSTLRARMLSWTPPVTLSPTDIYDPNLFDSSTSISGSSIALSISLDDINNRIMSQLIDDAQRGRLGEVSALEMRDIREIRTLKPATKMADGTSDIIFTPGSSRDLEATALERAIYYYRDIPDLARILTITIDDPTASPAAKMSKEVALAYANEIDKRRKVRFNWIDRNKPVTVPAPITTPVTPP